MPLSAGHKARLKPPFARSVTETRPSLLSDFRLTLKPNPNLGPTSSLRLLDPCVILNPYVRVPGDCLIRSLFTALVITRVVIGVPTTPIKRPR